MRQILNGSLPKQDRDKLRPVLNAKEAAAFLNVTAPTFKKLLNSGEIPFKRTSKRIFILRTALENWLANN